MHKSGLLINEPTLAEAFQLFKNNNTRKNIKTLLDYDRFHKKFTEFLPDNSYCSEITKIIISHIDDQKRGKLH